jgi:glycosyltransferase involved in cell wall biosynthesis
LKAAKGLYLNFLDDDDVLYPDHVETLVALLNTTGKKVGYSGVRNVYFRGPVHLPESRVREEVIFNLEFDTDLLLFENYVPSMSVLFCRDVLSVVVGFCEDLDLFEDWDFWIRVSRHFPFAHTDRITAEYRFYGVDSIEVSHRGKYSYDRALAKLFDRNRALMDGEAWLRFLDRGLPARTRKENEACLAWSRDLEKRLEQLNKANDECAAWGHGLQAELERVQAAHDACLARDHSLQDEINSLRGELNAAYGSTSWRITAPLRAGKKVLLQLRRLPIKVLRAVYRSIPVSDYDRYRTMSVVYRYFGVFFRRTASYQRWAHVKGDHQELKPVVPLPDLEGRDQRWILEFPSAEPTEISVIVSLNELKETTLPCMVALHQVMLLESSELIIVDHLPLEDKRSFFEKVAGVKITSDPDGSGLASSWNRGARMASGRYLVFLHRETQVTSNWLRELVGGLRDTEQVGLAGSKVIRRDGRLGEAGGAIEDNVKLWLYGTDQDPRSPQYCYVREVDFCSGISLAITKDLFLKVGGFDEALDGESPSYMGADLSLGVREIGKKVIYQALSEVICHDKPWPLDKSPRPETLSALASKSEKVFQARDERRLARRRPENCSEKWILMIDTWTPTPDKDSGSNDVVSYMKIFRSLSFGVTFIPAGDLAFLGGYTQDLQRMGIECLYAPFVKDVAAYLEAHGRRFDVVLLYRCHCASAYFESVRKHCPRAKIIFDTVDLHFLREQRQAIIEGSPVMAAQAHETKIKELSLIRQTDRTIVLSAAERNVLIKEHAIPDSLLSVIPIVREIPGPRNPFKTRRNILFIGGYEHRPNVDAVVYFASSIWPLVRERLAGVQFFVLGSKPPEEVVRLGEEPGVTVVGYVTDLSEYFDQCRLSVAPLRYGAGIKGKVGTSLSYGVPCVASSVAVEGAGMTDGVEVLIADDSEAFSDAVVNLYTNEDLWNTLSGNGLAFANTHYSMEAGRRKIAEMLWSLGVLDK